MFLALWGLIGEAWQRKAARLKQLTDGQFFIAHQQVETLERCMLGREESWGLRGAWRQQTVEGDGRNMKEEGKMMLIRFV